MLMFSDQSVLLVLRFEVVGKGQEVRVSDPELCGNYKQPDRSIWMAS